MASERRLDLIVNDVAATQGAHATYWTGGRGSFVVEASSWGGGSVTLEYQSPRGTWIAVGSEAVMTADGIAGFELAPGFLRATRATATGVYAYVIGSKIGGAD